MADVRDKTPAIAQPLSAVAVPFIAGIAMWRILPYPMLIVVLLVAGLLMLWSRRSRMVSLAALAMGLGCMDAMRVAPPIDDNSVDGRKLYYEGEVLTADQLSKATSLCLRLSKAGNSVDSLIDVTPVRIRLLVPTTDYDIKKGGRMTFHVSLAPLVSKNDIPYEYSPEQMDIEHGVRWSAYLRASEILKYTPPGRVSEFFNALHHKMLQSLFLADLSDGCKEFLAAALLGSDETLEFSTRNTFTSAGLSHVLALSGLHVGLIAMIVGLLLWPIRYFGYRRVVWILSLLVIWLYAAMTGMGASVTRAALMITVYLVGIMMQRRVSSINSIWFAALVILMFDPEALFSIGFQLSFAAVASIVLFSDKLNPVDRYRHKKLYAVVACLCVSLSAMLGTATVAAHHFHVFPVYFLLANAVASLMIPFVIGGGVVLVITGLCGAPSAWLAYPVDLLYQLFDGFVQFVAGLPSATIDGIYLKWFATVACCCMLLAMAMWLYGRGKRTLLTSVMVTSAVAFVVIVTTTNHQRSAACLYASSTGEMTNLVIDDCSGRLTIVSTMPKEQAMIEDRYRLRLADYMGRNDIDSILVKGWKSLKWGASKIIIMAEDIKPELVGKQKADYLVVAGDYRDDIEKLLDRIEADSVVLGADLHPRRTDAYENDCKRIGRGVINLRQRSWSLPREVVGSGDIR
ncbi:MAG: ComEC/Rec2 family competence protein [Bacteroides sp.]|nr:ComEC/Rec2 family competence protein [Bacteroides sp.]MCM1413138.1 ComEC/Rec2 family competence protein [Bacteroides sp.]MCM1472120.1 ComEC/Rec2 family competence protein [Bacteroides sp.]